MNAAQRRKQRRLPKKEAFKAKVKAEKAKSDLGRVVETFGNGNGRKSAFLSGNGGIPRVEYLP